MIFFVNHCHIQRTQQPSRPNDKAVDRGRVEVRPEAGTSSKETDAAEMDVDRDVGRDDAAKAPTQPPLTMEVNDSKLRENGVDVVEYNSPDKIVTKETVVDHKDTQCTKDDEEVGEEETFHAKNGKVHDIDGVPNIERNVSEDGAEIDEEIKEISDSGFEVRQEAKENGKIIIAVF